jgi:hypothetical protein
MINPKIELVNTDKTPKIATYLVENHRAHYHFTVKGNQLILLKKSNYFSEPQGAAFRSMHISGPWPYRDSLDMNHSRTQ